MREISPIPSLELLTKEKTNKSYDKREVGYILKYFPDLQEKELDNINQIFCFNGETLSLHEIRSLKSFFPEKNSEEIHNFLNSEKDIKKYIDGATTSSNKEKTQFWRLFSILPITDEIKKYALQKLLENKQDIAESNEAKKEPETEDEIASNFDDPVNLPVGELPHLETYLESKGDFNLPPARIFITDLTTGENMNPSIALDDHETSAAMIYAEQKLNIINKGRDKFVNLYKKEKQLPDSTIVDYEEAKVHYFKKMMRNVLRRVAMEKRGDNDLEVDWENIDIEIKFGQYKKGMPAELKSLVFNGAKLEQHYYERIVEDKEKSGIDNNEKQALQSPGMIDFSNNLSYIFSGQDTIMLNDLPTHEHEKKSYSTSEKKTIILNELQRSYMEITRATKKGDWSRAIELYIKYQTYLPQYIEHRFGVKNVYDKFKNNEISFLPKRILSVASGPHEELRAHYDFSKLLPEYEVPAILSLDLTKEMLIESRKKLPEEVKENIDCIDVVENMTNIKEAIKSMNKFDMIECSSFDNLKNEDDAKNMILQIINATKEEGLLKFMINEPFSEDFCRVIKNNDVEIIEKNKMIRLGDEGKKMITQEWGESDGGIIIKRINQKLKRHLYFLAKINGEIDEEKLKKELQEVSVFSPRQKLTAAFIKKEIKKQSNANAEEKSDHDIRIDKIVATHPDFFVERKRLDEKYLRYALSCLKPHMDIALARDLYSFYFRNPKGQKFTDCCDLVMDLIMNTPGFKKYLPINLLEHTNQRAKEIYEDSVVKDFEDYATVFLGAELSADTKSRVLGKINYSDATIHKISQYIHKYKNTDIDALKLILDNLPDKQKIDLPIDLRFLPELQSYYFKHSDNAPKDGECNHKEIKEIFSTKTLDMDTKNKLLNESFDENLYQNDRFFAKSLFDFLDNNASDLTTESFIKSNNYKISELVDFLEKNAHTEELSRLFDFKENRLGQKIDERDKQKLREEKFLHEYKIIFDKYFTQRKSIKKEKDSFINELNKLIEKKSQEFSSETEALYFIKRYLPRPEDSKQGTPKGLEMHEETKELLWKKIKEKIEEIRSLPENERAVLIFGKKIARDVRTYDPNIDNILKHTPRILNSDKILECLMKYSERDINLEIFEDNLSILDNPELLKKLINISITKERDARYGKMFLEKLIEKGSEFLDRNFLKELIEFDSKYLRNGLFETYKECITDEALKNELSLKLWLNGRIKPSKDEIKSILDKQPELIDLEILNRLFFNDNAALVINYLDRLIIKEQKDFVINNLSFHKNGSPESQEELIIYICRQNELIGDTELMEELFKNSDRRVGEIFIKQLSARPGNEYFIRKCKMILLTNNKVKSTKEEIEDMLTSNDLLYEDKNAILLTLDWKQIFDYYLPKLNESEQKEFLLSNVSHTVELGKYLENNINLTTDREFIEKIALNNLKAALPYIALLEESGLENALLANLAVRQKNYPGKSSFEGALSLKQYDELLSTHHNLNKKAILVELEKICPAMTWQYIEELPETERSIVVCNGIETAYRRGDKEGEFKEKIKNILRKYPDLLTDQKILEMLLKNDADQVEPHYQNFNEWPKKQFIEAYLFSPKTKSEEKEKILKDNQEILNDAEFIKKLADIREPDLIKKYIIPKLDTENKKNIILRLLSDKQINSDEFIKMILTYDTIIKDENNIKDIIGSIKNYPNDAENARIALELIGIIDNYELKVEALTTALSFEENKKDLEKIIDKNLELLEDEKLIKAALDLNFEVLLPFEMILSENNRKAIVGKLLPIKNYHEKAEEISRDLIKNNPGLLKDSDFVDKVISHIPEFLMEYSDALEQIDKEKLSDEIEKKKVAILNGLLNNPSLELLDYLEKRKFNEFSIRAINFIKRKGELSGCEVFFQGIKKKDGSAFIPMENTKIKDFNAINRIKLRFKKSNKDDRIIMELFEAKNN